MNHTISRTTEASWGPNTRAVRGGTQRSPHNETSEALYLTSGYVYDCAAQAEARFNGELPGYVYSRFGNPTINMFERRLAMLEGAEACRATATGMAAVFAALMGQLKAGDHVVSSRALFGSCHYIVSELLPRYGVEVTLVDGADLERWEAAFRPNTRCAFLETPANPTLELVDIAAVAKMAKAVGARLVVDNAFATPLLQRPLALGADLVVYSATKHIDGQGRCLGGAILGNTALIEDEILLFLRHTGPGISPFNAWVMLKGLETLALRVQRMGEGAREIATFLEEQPAIARVLYPGLDSHPQRALAKRQMEGGGTIVSFELPGGKAATFAFLDALQLIDISNNLGDAKSLITHPATTTHQRLSEQECGALGITGGLVRLSVGLEDVADLKADLARGLAGL